MVSSSPSPRGFESAEADEAAREAARAEARRYRAEELANAFPRREIPVGGCPAGARWSPSVGTCVAAQNPPENTGHHHTWEDCEGGESSQLEQTRTFLIALINIRVVVALRATTHVGGTRRLLHRLLGVGGSV